MNNIKLTTSQFYQLIKLSSELPVNDAADVRETMGENIRDAIRLCKELSLELSDIENTLNNAMYALVDKRLDDVINGITKYTDLAKTIKEDTTIIENLLAGSISKFIEISEPENSLNIIVSKEEIQATIDKNFEIYPVMSVGYHDGNFALIFGEEEFSIDTEPFIFAKGKEEDYDEAQRFIETFLDLEEIEE